MIHKWLLIDIASKVYGNNFGNNFRKVFITNLFELNLTTWTGLTIPGYIWNFKSLCDSIKQLGGLNATWPDSSAVVARQLTDLINCLVEFSQRSGMILFVTINAFSSRQ